MEEVRQSTQEGKKVALLLPFYKAVTPQTNYALLRLFDRSTMAVLQKHGDAFIVHTRNRLANAFVRTGIPYALWIDDDMILPCGDAEWYNRETGFNLPPKYAGMNLVDRLVSHRKSLIGGLYFGRNKLGRPMYSEGITDPIERAQAHNAPQDAVHPCTWVATGAMLVHRQVFLDIQAKFPHLAPQTADGDWGYFSKSETSLVVDMDRALQILSDPKATDAEKIESCSSLLKRSKETLIRQRSHEEGEDVSFCRRALVAGHQPHVDLGAVCGHVGSFVYGPRGRVS